MIISVIIINKKGCALEQSSALPRLPTITPTSSRKLYMHQLNGHYLRRHWQSHHLQRVFSDLGRTAAEEDGEKRLRAGISLQRRRDPHEQDRQRC